MKKWIFGSVAVALAALAVLSYVTAPTDEQLIRQAIDESTEASRKGQPGGVLDYLSSSLTFNGLPIMDKQEVSKYVRLARPDITFGEFTPVVEGDRAAVVADVHIKMDWQGLKLDQTVPDVEVKLAKETGYRWLVLPGKKWRITEVMAPDLGQFAEGGL
jgi:hypothetical protein